MDKSKLTILGSTGSIGCSTCEVIDAYPDKFEIIALAAGRNMELFARQLKKYQPQYGVVYSEKEIELLQKENIEGIELSCGQEGLTQVASLKENDIVLNALVGAAGLKASLETINAGSNLALANKESLVVGGPLFEPAILKSGGKILPVDSEHSAIWQCLKSGKDAEVRNILLTASGGPFRERDTATFKDITLEEALAHPTWKMGPKITIDSATMMNKGLELIEAVWLFSVAPEQIKIIIHPQSIVHSMVEFVDSSVIAQLSNPDMKLPIAYALFWPDRYEADHGRIDIVKTGHLDFFEPDEEKFPALRLAREVAEAGGTAPAVLNAVNEIAVAAFLDKKLRFTEITELIERILVEHTVIDSPNLDDILSVDDLSRNRAAELIRNELC
ncbi:MAG: 1-deoxy-D-xylulose-5-phosphate reductoisomerase [candidate division Zixibacteria bacterium]|nr:1-deoxy-D-xylulose-5-phosphate reductoisomerase [candidate division Zixibacteria bacterium]